jgi:hypothetical protein
MNKMKNAISKYYSIVLLLLTVLMLFAAAAKPIVWPSKIQADIEQIQKEMLGKADRVKVEGDQALINNDIEHMKNDVRRIGKMVEHLYFRSGGKPLEEKEW